MNGNEGSNAVVGERGIKPDGRSGRGGDGRVNREAEGEAETVLEN